MKKIFVVVIFFVLIIATTLAQQSQRPSAQAEAAMRAALANEGTITVLANSSGAVLKTMQVNPAEAQLGTPRGNFLCYILNPARLAIEGTNKIHQDLYQVQLPRTIPENNLDVVVGTQFSGTRFGGRCGVTILSNRGNVFKVQINGSGSFYDENNNRTPATVIGIFEVTYVGQVNPRQQQQPQTQEQKDQQAMDMIQGLLNQR